MESCFKMMPWLQLRLGQPGTCRNESFLTRSRSETDNICRNPLNQSRTFPQSALVLTFEGIIQLHFLSARTRENTDVRLSILQTVPLCLPRAG